MKKLRVQIYAYKHHADFIIESEDYSEAVENAIIAKLGENDIKWEYLGEMNDPKVNRITYEEVIEDGAYANTSERPLYKEKGSGPRMGAGAS